MELLARLETRFAVTLPEASFAVADTPRDLLRALVAARAPRARLAVVEAPPPGEAEPAPATVQTLVQLLAWHARCHAERPHIRLLREDGDEVVTYGALAREAEVVAAGLQALGIAPGQSVALMLPTSRDYFVSFFGVLLAGAVPVPIYPPARPSQLEDHVQRHRGILANALAAVLITVPEARRVARLLRARLDAPLAVRTVVELKTAARELRAPGVGSADTALLQYTSGSTGNPKGVVLTHANLLANIRAMGQAANVDPTDVFVSWLPLYHDMGLIGAWLGSLYYAIPLVVMSPLAFLARPSRWLWALHRQRATLSASPNFGYELCLRRIEDRELDGLDLSSVRLLFNGAEAVSAATVERFCERLRPYGLRREAMTPVYGLAECSVGLAFPPLDRGPRVDRIDRRAFMATGAALPAGPGTAAVLRFVSCGHPLPGHEIRIVDGANRELPERHQGLLQFRGPSATSGYFRNPAATRVLFVDGWLESGDLGYVADGEIYITGRRKDVIIHAGRNIYPDEIEEAVGDLAGIRKGRVAVFGSPDPRTGTERLIVLAETREQDATALDALRARINACVADLAGTAPDDVRLAPPQTILKTSSGKVRRSASREMYERGAVGRAPRSAAWQMLRLAASALPPAARRLYAALGALLYAGHAWTVFGLVAPVTWALVVALPSRKLRWAVLRRAARLFSRACGVSIVARGLEHLPPPGRACILVANHASYLDGYALVAALPQSLSFVAKTELRKSPGTGLFLRRIGSEFVERFDRQRGIADARRLVGLARGGKWLTFFPEGTFTRAPGLLPFHLGAFVAAAESSVPIIPVTLRGTRSVLRGDSWFPRRGSITVTVGPALDPAVFRAQVPDAWSLALKLRDTARAEILTTSHEPDLAVPPPLA